MPGIRESQRRPALRQVIDTGLPRQERGDQGTTPAHPGIVREWSEHFYPLRSTRDGARPWHRDHLRGSDGPRRGGACARRKRVRSPPPPCGPDGWCTNSIREPARSRGRDGARDLGASRRMSRSPMRPSLPASILDDLAATGGRGQRGALNRTRSAATRRSIGSSSASTGAIRWVAPMATSPARRRTAMRLLGTVQDIHGAGRSGGEPVLGKRAALRSMADNAPIDGVGDARGRTPAPISIPLYEFTGQGADEPLDFRLADGGASR